MAVDKKDQLPKRRIFEAAGVMGVQDLQSALQGEDEQWHDFLSHEGLMTLGEMGIIIHEEERGLINRVKPPRAGVVLHTDQ